MYFFLKSAPPSAEKKAGLLEAEFFSMSIPHLSGTLGLFREAAQGVQAAEKKVEEKAKRIATRPAEARELAGLQQSRRIHEANLRLLRAADRQTEETLDLFA